jgi:hypothetical protein
MGGKTMIYVVMSQFKDKEIDDEDSHYRYVRVFSDRVKAENYAKKVADKAKGIPEESVFGLLATTSVPVPEVAMTPAT